MAVAIIMMLRNRYVHNRYVHTIHHSSVEPKIHQPKYTSTYFNVCACCARTLKY